MKKIKKRVKGPLKENKMISLLTNFKSHLVTLTKECNPWQLTNGLNITTKKRISKNIFVPIEDLGGVYNFKDNSFFINDIEFRFLKRKKTTRNKPELYLGAFLNKVFIYVSSLYPVKENVYNFDYKDVFYTLQIEKDNIKISRIDKQDETDKQS